MNTNILLILVLSFVVTSCSQTENINEKNIHLHVKELSSDKFEGREPGTVGGELTKKYIQESFKSSGLQPIKKDFLLEVPLSKMEVNLDESYLKFKKAKNQRILIPGEETVFWSKRVKKQLKSKIAKFYLLAME